VTRYLLVLVAFAPTLVLAEPWEFGDAVTVAGDKPVAHYHHLDGAGRQHVAASDAAVALVWEDDRSGTPQVYCATKLHPAHAFTRTEQLSDGVEAYEPAIVTLGEGRWLAAWEQDGALKARIIDVDRLGPVQTLAGDGGRQVTLARDRSGRIAAVWARRQGRGQLIAEADLKVDGLTVTLAADPVAVAPLAEHPFQAYPSAVWGPNGRLVVAWEDRRAGHTRLFYAWREAGKGFAAARQLNEHNAPAGEDGATPRLGSGVMRVMLATDTAGAVQAVWLDKRHAASGYAVWGAASRDGGRTFGANRIVQDEHGAAVAQWHAALTGGEAGFVAAWDDAREGWGDSGETGDILLSWTSGDGWSPDLLVPGASGQGYQGSPAVALDPHGGLHLVWIARADLTAPTRLRYLHGRILGP
jgi:hypothetical protein